jgi:hypothetical protein
MKAKPSLKPSQALKRVKKRLPDNYKTDASGNSPYICDNIKDLWQQGEINDETKNTISSHINTLLDGKFCLKSWLVAEGKVSYEELQKDYNQTWIKLQLTRQLWLDDMILHFKSKGM